MNIKLKKAFIFLCVAGCFVGSIWLISIISDQKPGTKTGFLSVLGWSLVIVFGLLIAGVSFHIGRDRAIDRVIKAGTVDELLAYLAVIGLVLFLASGGGFIGGDLWPGIYAFLFMCFPGLIGIYWGSREPSPQDKKLDE